MFDENGLGDDGTDAAGTQEPGEGGDDMDEKDEVVAHVGIEASLGFDRVYVPNQQFAMHRVFGRRSRTRRQKMDGDRR